MLHYKEYMPKGLLRLFIDYYWELEFTPNSFSDNYEERVTPLGYSEIIIHYGDLYEQKKEQVYSELPRTLYTGQITTFKMFRPKGVTGILGVRFKPYGAYFFLPEPMFEFTDQCVDLRRLYSNNLVDALEDQILSSKNNAERIEHVEDFLLRSFQNVKPNIPIHEIVKSLYHQKGNQNIHETASRFNCSVSKLERNFKSIIGISPKKFSRIIRYNEVLKSFKNEINVEDLAFSMGYYDKSHFIKEFSQFSGFTPAQFSSVDKSLTEKIIIGQNADFLHQYILR